GGSRAFPPPGQNVNNPHIRGYCPECGKGESTRYGAPAAGSPRSALATGPVPAAPISDRPAGSCPGASTDPAPRVAGLGPWFSLQSRERVAAPRTGHRGAHRGGRRTVRVDPRTGGGGVGGLVLPTPGLPQ